MGGTCQTLTVEEILDINRQLILDHGGAGIGFLNRGSLEFALEEIHGSVFGTERCPTAFDKAATLGWRWIAKGHVFIDGNKRTGMVCALTFLEINGLEFDAPGEDVFSFAKSIAQGLATIQEFSDFLKRHTR